MTETRRDYRLRIWRTAADTYHVIVINLDGTTRHEFDVQATNAVRAWNLALEQMGDTPAPIVEVTA